jgi:cell division protease FtsH
MPEIPETPPEGDNLPRRRAGVLFPLLVLLFIVVVVILSQMNPNLSPERKVTYGKLMRILEGKEESLEIESALKKTDELELVLVDQTGKKFRAFIRVDEKEEVLDKLLVEKLGDNYDKEKPSAVWPIILSLAPWVILIFLFWFFVLRQMRSPGGGGVLSFGKSRAKVHTITDTQITFEDVAGIQEAQEEVQEIIEFLRGPTRFQKLGGRIPRGVLLVGPPGCGKTLLAKAIAGEAGVPFYSISGSDFVEMFVGVGASRVRDLFKQARENAPCIIFLDEIDAVGRKRGSGLGGGHDEREQTLNAILVEMDGFDTGSGVVLIAATNRPDVLDPALLRPGRFDREIVIDPPDINGREEILRVHGRRVKLAHTVNLQKIARATPYFSGADLEALLNEAALMAAMKGKEAVEQDDLEEARDKVRWGRQKKSRVLDEEDKRITAYHEAGHAILHLLIDNAEQLHKVTIIPRGMSLGATMFLPEKDIYHVRKSKLVTDIKILYGGRIAEEIFFQDVTSGAQNDITRASELARMMVTKWGMSAEIGPISFDDSEEHLFLGRQISRQINRSEATAQLIDEEVKKIIESCYAEAKAIIKKNKKLLEKIAEALVQYEVLDGDDVRLIVEGGDIDGVKSRRALIAEKARQALSDEGQSDPNAMTSEEERDLSTHGGPEPTPA